MARASADAPKSAFEEVNGLYQAVIEDVIRKIKPEFQAEGVDESLLRDLEKRWRRKLEESGAVQPAAPVEDIKADISQQTLSVGLPLGAQAEYAELPYNPSSGGLADQLQRGNGMPSEVLMNVPPGGGPDAMFGNLDYEGQLSAASMLGKRKQPETLTELLTAPGAAEGAAAAPIQVKVEDRGETGAQAVGLEDDEELGNSDDLDDEEPETANVVLAQFDKVNRTKSRWKCNLKDGIMNLNGRDIVFHKANGEFDF